MRFLLASSNNSVYYTSKIRGDFSLNLSLLRTGALPVVVVFQIVLYSFDTHTLSFNGYTLNEYGSSTNIFFFISMP